MLESVRREPPTSLEIADWIRERIRRGQFAPEQRLVEVDIIRKTGGRPSPVSPTSPSR